MIGYIASILVGVLLGALGSGGSMLTLPVFVYLFHLEPGVASGYSMFVVGVTSLVGVAKTRLHGPIDFAAAFRFGVPLVATTFFVRMILIPNLPDSLFAIGGLLVTSRVLLLTMFAVLLIGSSVRMLRSGRHSLENFIGRPTYVLVIAGAVVGLITGMVGIGGGFLIIPTLMFLFNLSFRTAVTTSLCIISLNCCSGFFADVTVHKMDWMLLLKTTAFAISGMWAGTSLTHKLPQRHLQVMFACFSATVGVLILFREIFW